MTIVTAGSTMGLWIDTEHNGIVKALLMEVDLSINTVLRATENYIRGNITNYELKLKLLESEIKNLSIEEINIFFQMIFKYLIPQLNVYLNDGIPLPPIKPFFSFRKSELKLFDRYIRVSINPEPIKDNIRASVRAAIDELFLLPTESLYSLEVKIN